MRILVTGSSGHLGEALVRTLRGEVLGLDILRSPTTHQVGSISDRDVVRQAVAGVDVVIHTATLHKPHVSSHSKQEFVDTNVTGTLNLLEESVAAGVKAFIFTSTTSAFGRALTPGDGEPATWITEAVRTIPRNIYGATKCAAEDLCELIARDAGMPVVILRTSRFFPEPDDHDDRRKSFEDLNLKVNELLYRRADLADIVAAHRCAIDRASEIGFGRYIITATTPLSPDDRAEVRHDLPAVVRRLYPDYEQVYAARGWRMLPAIDRVYANDAARRDLGWAPQHDFGSALAALANGKDPRSALSVAIGAKGYHPDSHGVYTTR